MLYSRGKYTNTLANVNPNAIPDGWGDYQYPGGVPNDLLDTVNWRNEATNCTFPMRKELVTLCGLCLTIAADRYNYQVWGDPNPGTESTWGPWGYENRTIGGTNRPSNHSKGRAWDWNAPSNSYTDWTSCEIPPGLVGTMQELGWYWGGFYGDRMHFEYVGRLFGVPDAEARAREILGQSPTPTPTPTPKPDPKPPTTLLEWIMTLPGAPKDLTYAQLLADVGTAAANRVALAATNYQTDKESEKVTERGFEVSANNANHGMNYDKSKPKK